MVDLSIPGRRIDDAPEQHLRVAADFDGKTGMLDALAYVKAARTAGVPAALEISQSGAGAHVWIFFTEAIPAQTARAVGTAAVSTCSTDMESTRVRQEFTTQSLAT